MSRSAPSVATSTSPLVTIPPGPDPGTACRSTPFFAAARRASGAASTSELSEVSVGRARLRGTAGGVGASLRGGRVPGRWGAGARQTSVASRLRRSARRRLRGLGTSCGLGWWRGRWRGCGRTAAGPGAMTASVAPTATVSPSAATISVSRPVAGAGTSTSTLSVVTSTTGSPSSTLSPTALSQRDTIPSETDSPIAGRVSETGSATLESSHLRSSAVRLAVDRR